MKKLPSPVYAIARQKSAAIRRLILAAAMLAGLLARWTAWPVRAELAGDAPPLAAVSLEASADTWLRKGSSTINYGGTSLVQTSSYTGPRQHILLQWDVSSIPQTATIDSASITFYVTDASAFDFSLYQMRREWVEGNHEGYASFEKAPGANWNSPYYQGSPISWGALGAMSTVSDRFDVDLWDATNATFELSGIVTISLNSQGINTIQNWLNSPSTNFGLTIQYMGTDNSGDNWIVASSENADFLGPTLNVTYSVPPAIQITGALPAFSVHAGVPSAAQSYTVSAANLSEDLVITAPAPFEIATASAGPFSSTITLAPSNGAVSSTLIYVRFHPALPGMFSGQITHASTGAATANLPVNGEATNNAPSATNPTPGNNAINVSTPVLLTVAIADIDGDAASVTFYGRQVNAIPPEAFAQIYTASNVSAGSNAYALWVRSFTAGERYEWCISASDGFTTATSTTWPFTAGEPTAVELNYFRASRNPGGVLLSWETVSEATLAGFNLYRCEPGGEFVQINAGLIAPQMGGQPLGSAYTWLDEGIPLDRRYEYRLEGIETNLQPGSFAHATFWPFALSLPAVQR